ncbi:helix-turn-helix domain-containing protein [Bacillus thuringiensis]|uniref:helix-turn-helix domain-containing protein n=1 Tax=Bacillus thuringiensis TaxID=1428 RepID=UPI00211D5A4B|nr:helix-turn-helix transcriptional regulator [Bacillus thuringiensis]
MIKQETIERRKKQMDSSDNNTPKTFSFSKSVSLPKEYYMIDRPKHNIAKSIKVAIDEQNLSLRKLAAKIEGISYPQISRVTSKENYNIDTLLKILDGLNLELIIKPKK